MSETERLRELIAINRTIASTLDYDEVLRVVVEKTAEFSGADACVLLLKEGEDRARPVAWSGLDGRRVAEFSAPLDENIAGSLRTRLDFDDEDFTVGVPVIEHGALRGVLVVYARGPRELAGDEEALLSALADQAAIALSHAEQYRRAKEALEATETLTARVFQYAPLGILVFTKNLVVVELNETAAALLQSERASALGARLDAVAPKTAEVLTDALGRAETERDDAVFLPEVEDVFARARADGESAEDEFAESAGAARQARGDEAARAPSFWDLRVVNLPEGRRGEGAAVVLAADVTERVRAQRRARQRDAELRASLERHARELKEANEAKDVFFNALSHELRTPLATIQNAVELLKLKERARGSERAIDTLERNIGRLVRLIDDILDLSRMMRGRLALHREPLALEELVEALVDSWRPKAEEAEVALHFEGPREPARVYGDQHRLAQVLDNLVSNALKYTPSGGSVSVRVDPEGEDVVLNVADTGEGISPEDLPHIFEPFHQTQTPLSRARAGLGIGLSIAHSLVTLHGGSLTASSEGLGRGSAFAVRLPRHRDEDAPSGEADAPDAEGDAPTPPAAGGTALASGAGPTGAEGAPRGRRVLLVEDNVDLRASLAQLLTKRGHEIAEASDAKGALEAAPRLRPEAIVIDIGLLPDMDGHELAQSLRRTAGLERARLIALTGYAGEADRARARESGFDHYLAKPADLAALERALRE